MRSSFGWSRTSAGTPSSTIAAFVHEDEPVADLARELHLVRDDEHRHPGPGQVAHDEQHLADELRIERRRRPRRTASRAAPSSAPGRSRPAAAGRPRAGADTGPPSPRADARRAARARGPRRPPRSACGHARAASVTLSITFRCGNRLNCWNTIPIRWRTVDTLVPLPVTSSPSRNTRPESTGSSRLTQRSKVLLPLPLGPMTTRTSPRFDAQVDAVEHEVRAEALPDRLQPHHRAAVLAVGRWREDAVRGVGASRRLPGRAHCAADSRRNVHEWARSAVGFPVRVALMIEGQGGVTWPQWVALAQTAERAGIEALFRSDHYTSVGARRRGLARRLDDARGARGRDGADPARDARLAGDVPASRRCSRAPSSPSTTSRAGASSSAWAPAGWSSSTALRLPVPAVRRAGGDAGRAGRDRSPPVDGGAAFDFRGDDYELARRAGAAEAGAAAASAADHRRRWATARSLEVAARWADEYNTYYVGPSSSASCGRLEAAGAPRAASRGRCRCR